ncbi:MAG: hypothetical protein KJ717_14060, partial [Proteobacteria bacterium]|nr:hypothetical protein [Pseudomonadota bacterium]
MDFAAGYDPNARQLSFLWHVRNRFNVDAPCRDKGLGLLIESSLGKMDFQAAQKPIFLRIKRGCRPMAGIVIACEIIVRHALGVDNEKESSG